MGWFQYDGDNGIDAFFDPVRNKSKKHFGDDSLVSVSYTHLTLPTILLV